MFPNEVLEALKKPFHPSQVYWKIGDFNDERSRALALVYADLRAYQNRLDEICGMEWSVTYTPWGERIVCHLTIHGVTRSSTGEQEGSDSPEAIAFRRACAMFGLGRYLYNLPSLWVEYDPQSRSFTERARARLDMIVSQHYRRVMDVQTVDEQPQNDESQEPTEGDEFHLGQVYRVFDALGQELYGAQWAQVSRHNAERVSNGQISDPGKLNEEQLQKLINGLQSMKRKRERVEFENMSRP